VPTITKNTIRERITQCDFTEAELKRLLAERVATASNLPVPLDSQNVIWNVEFKRGVGVTVTITEDLRTLP
jgi:hypothetical protein